MSRSHFAKLSDNQNDLERVGRPKRAELIEEVIFNDIAKKSNLDTRKKILDIGCGCGTFAKMLIEQSKTNGSEITFIDSSEVISVLKKENPEIECEQFKTVAGYYPDIIKNLDSDYDFILVYSVLHYIRQPERFIRRMSQLLSPGGILYVGDIPNQNKKTRFIANSSEFAKPKYFEKNDFTKRFSDLKLLRILWMLRKSGFESYIFPQNDSFPHSGSREDLVIFRISEKRKL
jgi:2-polyprenyl-3-methyl-5-hydroxy-6-metoxy-1,4-benzoquinol methylase